MRRCLIRPCRMQPRRMPRRRPAVINILAIAHKELKGYFASPIAYVVIGLYAVMFGYFFYALLLYFDRQSMQMAGLGGAQPVNVNEGLIRPVFLNTPVIFLFILPMGTMG